MLVPTGSEAPFLAPHQISVLPGVPDDILFRLDEYQLERIGQVAAIAESELCAVFGARGRLLRAQSRGIDGRPVLSPEVRAEYRLSHTLATDTNDLGVLHPLLRRITEALGRKSSGSGRLRRGGSRSRSNTPTIRAPPGAFPSPDTCSIAISGTRRCGGWPARWGGGSRSGR
jgi:nucleotidyltransferase/DNA polymerase involved in DNA repair